VIDGGKGQLPAARRAAEAAGAPDVAVIALAKREEEIHGPGGLSSARLARRNPGLRLLQRARDEAHRFAHGYNRKLRARRTLHSDLAGIRGIGPSRQRALLRRFGSLAGVRAASEEDLAATTGFSARLARVVKRHLEEDG
jgi:excinuclease ABC subunit C